MLAAALSVAWWLTTTSDAPTGASETSTEEVEVQPGKVEPKVDQPKRTEVKGEPAPDPFATKFDALARAIAAGKAADAAADLRKLLRTDEAALSQAYAALLAEETDAELRRALAMVLGTLAVDGVDDVLLAALTQFDKDATTVVALIAALGALRDPPDEDDVFDMEAAPHFAAHGPGGMGITVRNIIKDPRVEEALGNLLLDTDRADVRMAAVNAMQFSVHQEFSRTRFRTALTNELNDGVAAVLAQSLGYWTRRKQSDEARHIVDEVILAADRPGFDEYRMRVETALQESNFGEIARGQLNSWTQSGMSYEMRTFAFSALLCQKTVDPATRQSLINIVTADPNRAMRDYAARQLAKLPAGTDSRTALKSVFDNSTDWSLRSTALSSLVGMLPAAQRQALLQRAASDPDQRIVRRAQRLSRQFQ